MSADLLREAALTIRGEWEPPHGSAWSTVQKFHLAVADWLDLALEAHLGVQPGNYPFYQHALAVARAYLGRDA